MQQKDKLEGSSSDELDGGSPGPLERHASAGGQSSDDSSAIFGWPAPTVPPRLTRISQRPIRMLEDVRCGQGERVLSRCRPYTKALP